MDAVDVAKALASPSRQAILHWLKDPAGSFVSRREGDLTQHGACASLIADKIGVSQPTASRHLDILRRAELIETTRVAGWTFHRRDEHGIARALQLLGRI